MNVAKRSRYDSCTRAQYKPKAYSANNLCKITSLLFNLITSYLFNYKSVITALISLKNSPSQLYTLEYSQLKYI
jgi:hypothetical protein